ncbi:MAG: type II secretion system major pseudopilin GspG [Synergistaceae bacterium]|nr:type II secretion system major pseudopilin GspG [Synergistaceae bacterium]
MRKTAGHEIKGFRLVEILVVIIMLVLLTQLKVPESRGRRVVSSEARSATDVQIRELEHALDYYYKHNGFYPTTAQGLEALVTKPMTRPLPENYSDGGYMKRVPRDPWGNPFIYRNLGDKGLINIISRGPDGEEGTDDDITNHEK